LSSYLTPLYQREDRLDGWTEDTKATFGYLKIHREDNDIEVMVGDNAGTRIPCPFLDVAPDAVLTKNLTQKALISSSALNVAHNFVTEFNKNKPIDQRMFVPEIGDIPVLATGEVPAFCKQYFVAVVAALPPAAGGAVRGIDRVMPPPVAPPHRVPEGHGGVLPAPDLVVGRNPGHVD
jgi:hypothetical protein